MSFARAIALLNAVFYTLTGFGLLLAPQWFFDTIGTFPPFNRHYMGDLGSFLLALGGALFFGMRVPAWQPGLLAVAGVGGLLHALNHAADALRGTGGWDQTIAIGILALLTIWAAVRAPGVADRVETASSPAH